jgi:GGDEF domain-containing protein
MALLWVNVLAVPVFSIAGGHSSVVHGLDGGLAVAVLAMLGSAPRLSRKLRMACASLGLLSAAALLIHASGGLLEMHFYFFVLIIVLTLYEDWMPFLLAIVFVLIHHGVLGTLEPRSVFDRPEEWAHPWTWASIHAAFVAAAGVSALAAWRLNEDVRAKMRAAHEQLEVASETDSLTGLGNRRKLMADLEEVSRSGQPAVVVILDLDGFKAYNDTFGHPAGDSLLARLGARLQQAVERRGRAYRLGGDEFCAIWRAEEADRASAEAVSAAALCERGEGFSITAAYGGVAMAIRRRERRGGAARRRHAHVLQQARLAAVLEHPDQGRAPAGTRRAPPPARVARRRGDGAGRGRRPGARPAAARDRADRGVTSVIVMHRLTE